LSDRHRPSRSRLAWLAAGASAIALAALWQTLPVILWHGRFADQLAAEGDAGRLRAERWSSLPRPPGAWAELFAGSVALRAPLAAEALPACGRCVAGCRLPLDNRGTLALLDDHAPETYGEALDDFAPDARDLSVLRSVARNWRTIDALTDRVRAVPAPSKSFRYEAVGSRGVVTAFEVDGVRRYVVYAYSWQNGHGRVIGVAGLERARFEGLLGGLLVEPERTERAAYCNGGAGR
jgi:hypothetical protein